MNWTDTEAEKQKLISWAQEYGPAPGYLQRKSTKTDSFFQTFDNDEAIKEYWFATLPELKAKLDVMWADNPELRKISTVCAVAAFKEWDTAQKIQKDDSKNIDTFTIPDYVYVF